jgi:8-oxo-dGTP diphosphatase
MKKISKINIRVYGLVFNDMNEVLLTDEIHYGMKMTKFPGGGLKIGEGTIDCLHREFMEEMNQKVIFTEHFYTTDFFQKTVLIPESQQLISIYYIVKLKELSQIKTQQSIFSFENEIEDAQIFRWAKIDNYLEKQLSFPIDKIVAVKLLNTNINL